MSAHARRHVLRLPRRCAGVGLVTAIFLLVVLAGLGVAMVSLSSAQHAGSALDVQGARAYQAARAGLEWGLFQNLRTANRRCDASYSFALPAASSLNGFTVTVNCAMTAGPAVNASGDAHALDRWVIRATACNRPGNGACPGASNSPDYVQRVAEARL